MRSRSWRRLCLAFASSVLGSVIAAQSPLVTTFANNNAGNVGGAVYFDLQVNTTITATGLDVNLMSPVNTAGAIEVWIKAGTRVGFQTNQAAWTLAGTGACVAAGPGMHSVVATVPGVFTPGIYGIALRGVGLGFAYTNGNGSNQTYATAEVTASLGEATNTAFAAPLLMPRVANIAMYYTVGGSGAIGDECADALNVGLGTTATLSNAGYTSSAPPLCATGGNDRWFNFVAPSTGTYSFHTCNSDPGALDTVLEVLAGSCGALTSLGCNDDACGLSSLVSTPVVAGQSLYVRVGGHGTNTGTFRLTVGSVVADFTGTPTSGLAPLNVQFTSQSSTTEPGGIIAWAWDFDGDTVIDSTLEAPLFTYTTSGNYTVSLTVQDGVNPPVTTTKPNYVQVTSPAPGDECATATDVFIGNNGTFSNVGYTASTVSGQCGTWGAGDKDRWFRFVAPYAYPFRFSVVNASTSAQLELRSGACGAQTSLGCGTEVIATTNASSVYYVRVAGVGGTTGTFTLRIRPADDECDGAMPIAVGATATIHGDDYSPSAATICGAATFLDRWFVFTPPFSAPWTFSGHATSVLEVVPTCGGGQVACSTGSTTATLMGGMPVRLRLGMSPSQPNPTVLIAPGKGTGTAPADVVFNEACYDDQGTGSEFLELYNTTGNGRQIGGWYVVAVTASAQTTVLLVPPNTMIPAHGVWHAGASSSTALLQPLPDGSTSLRLHDQTGALVDTLAYEAVSGPLATQFLQGHPLFGEHKLTPGHPTSWGRNSDGQVTETSTGTISDNGFEWRIGEATPGMSNDLTANLPVQTSYEGITSAPEWGGCQIAPTLAMSPASPDGGQHLAFAAPASGGRSWFYKSAASDNYQLDAWVWLDLPNVLAGEYCVWSMGLCGTTDSEYRGAAPWRQRLDENGDTGVTWTYEVSNDGSGTVATLSLVDNGAGGTDHVILWHKTITAPDWVRLSLGVAPRSLIARFSTQFGPEEAFERPHDHAYGGVYVGIRQSQNYGFGLRIDDVFVDRSWNSHDTTGAGCDGNCPPKNHPGGALDRTVPLAATTWAILLPNAENFVASGLCFYLAAAARTHNPAPSVAIHGVVGVSGGNYDNAVPGAMLATGTLSGVSLEWWGAPLDLAYGGDLFLVLTLPDTIQPPILAERVDGMEPEQVRYRDWNGTSWSTSTWNMAPLAIRWMCAGDSGDVVGTSSTAKSGDASGMAMIDFTVTFGSSMATPVVLALGTTALNLPLDGIGAPTCKLFTSLDSLQLFVPMAGSQTASVMFPTSPALIGLSFHGQWGVFDPSFNAFGWRLSNRRTITIRGL